MYFRMLSFLVVLSVLWSSVPTLAQDSMQWLQQCYDAANSSSTSVDLSEPDKLALQWTQSAQTVRLGAYPWQPLVVKTTQNGQLLLYGDCIYDPWTGDKRCSLPCGGDAVVVASPSISEHIAVTVRSENGGIVYTAYDLENWSNGTPTFMWDLDSVDSESGYLADSVCDLCGIGGTIYVSGGCEGCGSLAAIDAETGVIKWSQNYPTEPQVSHLTGLAAGTVPGDDDELRDMVFLISEEAVTPSTVMEGLVAFDAADGTLEWWDEFPPLLCRRPTLDEINGTVFACVDDTYNSPAEFRAYDVNSVDATAPTFSSIIDGVVNGPPVLGETVDPISGATVDAVFIASNPYNDGATIYAFSRDPNNMRELWHKAYPEIIWTGMTYSKGKLYAVNFDRIHILDANNGNSLHWIPTEYCNSHELLSLVDIDPTNQNNELLTQPMIFYADYGNVYAFALGNNPPEPTYEYRLTLSAEPKTIYSGGCSTTITPQLLSNPVGGDVEGKTVTFSHDAKRDGGYLTDATVDTDKNGIATTIFVSERRDGVVHITASVADPPQVEPQSVAVAIVKYTEPDPDPPGDSASIAGVVTIDGKPARKVPLTLFGTADDERSIEQSTTTNPQGKYTFDGLPAGSYTVEVTVDGKSDSVDVDVADGEAAEGVNLEL